MEKLGYFIFGGAIAFIIAYFIFKEDKSNNTSNNNTVCVRYCVSKEYTELLSNNTLDAEMIEYYKEASNNGDSIGFTIERDLMKGLSAYLDSIEHSKGIRFYPGYKNSTKYILIKPLDAKGNEIEMKGKISQVKTDDINGPCPKWCGQGIRIIK